MPKIFRIFIVVSLFLLTPVQTFAGSFGKGEPTTNPGEWYEGDPPANIDPNKAPILFVHGLNSSSATWTDGNDMDEIAYQNGYETAYVNLYATRNMWDNGQLLADVIQEIYEHFGKKLVIVAHSKGGVDTQSALVHYGAHPYVKRVITLSSPHQGSKLADLAYSSWAGWLADILGSKNGATYSLQTGYMTGFRQQTDTHPNVDKVPFYTLAGTKWGSFGSALYWGGLYLRIYGENDGAVTVANSRLAYGNELAVGKWNHSTIKEGSTIFPYIAPYMQLQGVVNVNRQTMLEKAAALNEEEEGANLQTFYRGGNYKGKVEETFFVEDGVNQITINWLSEKKDTNVMLMDPKGKRITDFSKTMDDSPIFQGAYVYQRTIDHPIPGKWKIIAMQKEEHYLMNVIYDSPLNEDLIVEAFGGKELKITVSPKSGDINNGEMTATISLEFMNVKNKHVERALIKKDSKTSAVRVTPFGDGIYNVTIDVKGKTVKGFPFNRTIITSVYVGKTPVK
ncbi:esterase/lipase family protein [Fervidibacillus halotolerans]|uniref:GPI inositol-deacylase PGAP1-like alpha/beta domain-containing protein n=1 Tax=Fervidibacillus halotolerans TaxID=2980027 RepID=A0A9E8RYT0_9BACI|nr:hypothetical protein [Fervidibacillus halotolerans]WAA12588.1 hypothetical protein OE105_00080 [Fervidibacillus halotolerans]